MGKGHRTCEVCGVKERHTGENFLLFSQFPLNPKRCREWVKAVGNEELVHLPIEKLHKQRNICGNHFQRKDFNRKGNRLNRHAIPTLNLMALPLTETQVAEFPQHKRTHRKGRDDAVLHSFPNPDKDMDRYLAWARAVGSHVSSVDSQYVYKNRRVCHAHFEPKFLTWTKRLSPNAIPTLFLQDEIEKRPAICVELKLNQGSRGNA